MLAWVSALRANEPARSWQRALRASSYFRSARTLARLASASCGPRGPGCRCECCLFPASRGGTALRTAFCFSLFDRSLVLLRDQCLFWPSPCQAHVPCPNDFTKCCETNSFQGRAQHTRYLESSTRILRISQRTCITSSVSPSYRATLTA